MESLIRWSLKAQKLRADAPLTYTYTFEDLRELLSPWYEIYDIRKDHIFPYEIGEYKRGRYKKTERFRNMEEADFKKMEAELGWHTLVKARRL